jgi:hypothetical protein
MNLPVSVCTDVPALSQDGIERSKRKRRPSITSAEQSIRQGDIRATLDLENLYQAPQGSKKSVLDEKNKHAETRNVVVRLNDLHKKIQTGFLLLLTMMGYIAVICKGEIKEITKTTSSTLTWFVEWYSFFKILYWKSLIVAVGRP